MKWITKQRRLSATCSCGWRTISVPVSRGKSRMVNLTVIHFLQMLIYGHQILGARHTSYEWARSKR